MTTPNNEAVTSFQLGRRDSELLRIIASVSVVVVHCAHQWVQYFFADHNFASMGLWATLLDQFTRFTVPLFFFLSGFGLTLQFNDKPRPLLQYYRFRLTKILIPFLVWSAITAPRHILYIESWNWSDNPWGTIGYFFRFLFLDGFDYQYYFLIVIFQFYLVFPLLWKLGRSKLFAGIFLILHLLVTSPIEAYLDIFGLHLPPLHSNMLILHWFWCYMGIYAACNRDFLADVAKRWSLNRVLLVWFGFFALLNIEFVFNMRAGKALSDIDHFNRWSVVLYCLGSLLLFLKLKPRLSKTIISNPNFDFLFTHVAPYTFFVYLVHTHVLRFVDYLAYEDTGFDLLSRIFFVVLGSYGLAWLAQWLLDEFPKLRFVLGLPGHPLALRSLPGVKRFTTYFALNWGRKARSNSTG